MHRNADRQRQRTFRAQRPGLLHGGIDGGAFAGDHDLAGGIEVGRFDHAGFDPPAGLDHGVVGKADDSRHRALARRHRRLHQAAAFRDETHRVGQVERAGANQRAVFAEAVARHHGCRRLVAGIEPGAIARDPGAQHRRLGDLGLVQAVFGSLGDDLAQVVAKHLRSGLEYRVNRILVFVPVGHHADRLRSLAGKYVGVTGHESGSD